MTQLFWIFLLVGIEILAINSSISSKDNSVGTLIPHTTLVEIWVISLERYFLNWGKKDKTTEEKSRKMSRTPNGLLYFIEILDGVFLIESTCSRLKVKKKYLSNVMFVLWKINERERRRYCWEMNVNRSYLKISNFISSQIGIGTEEFERLYNRRKITTSWYSVHNLELGICDEMNWCDNVSSEKLMGKWD